MGNKKPFFSCIRFWSMVNGQWSMVNGQWSMVNGQWSMVNGQWSMVWLEHIRPEETSAHEQVRHQR